MSEKKKCIHDGHRKRLINTVEKAGIENLSEVQALEYILFFIFPRGDVNPLAHRLLDRFANISTVLDAPVEDLKMVEGMGETSAKKLHSLLDIFYLYSLDKGSMAPYKTIGELYDYMEEILRFKPNEEIYVIGINNKGNACKERKLAQGSFSEVKIDMKEIALYITTYNVNRIIIVHNHPNGKGYPSQADKDSTEKLKQICRGVGCELIDSLIVGQDGIWSVFNDEIKRYFTKSLRESVLENSPEVNLKRKSI